MIQMGISITADKLKKISNEILDSLQHDYSETKGFSLTSAELALYRLRDRILKELSTQTVDN